MRVVLDGVFNHTGRGFWPFHHVLETGAASPYRDWFHLDPDVLAGHRLLTPYPPLDAPTGFSLGLQGVVGPAGAAEAQHRPPRRPRVPAVGRRALAALRDRRLAAGRPDRDRRPVVLGGVPAPLPGDPPRRLPRRRDLGSRAGLARRRRLRRADELPAGRGDPRVRRRAQPRHGRRPRPPRVPPAPPPARRPRVRDPARRAAGRLRPGRRRRPAQPHRLARRAAGADRARRRSSPRCAWRRCSSARCPARRPSTTATRSA